MLRLLKNIKNTAFYKKSTDSRASVGIDIGQHGIRMVQLARHSLNQIRLEKYVVAKLPPDMVKDGRIQDYDGLATYLQHCYSRLHSSCRHFTAALPLNLTTLEHLACPPDQDKDGLEAFAEVEAAQVSPLADIQYDYQLASASENQEMLLAVGKRDDIEPRIDLFEQADMPLSALDVDILAQRNAYAYCFNHTVPDLADEKTALFGIYDTQMYALIMQGGRMLYKHETAVSGEQLVRLIQNTYQVGTDTAERMMAGGDRPAGYQEWVADRFNVQVTQEIQRVLQFFYTSRSGTPLMDIKQIFLTGAAARQPGLAESIYAHTETPTRCLHPAACVETGTDVDAAAFHADAPSLTLAFGLALRGL